FGGEEGAPVSACARRSTRRMPITRREPSRQGLAWRGDAANRLNDLERMVADLGHVRSEATCPSSWAPAHAPSAMTRERAMALTAAMYPGESSRRWRRPT